MLKEKFGKIVESRVFIALSLGMLIFIASVPAFRSATYQGHDLKFHFGRIQAIAESLQQGQFPVRYESNAWYGHGYVSSLFYGNIFLYFPAVLFMTGLPMFRAYNIYVIAVNIATVLVAYLCFKRMFKDKIWGECVTVVYTLAGYHLTNLYVRTALGEYTAMIFIPLCIYGVYRIYEEQQVSLIKRILPLVVGMTGLIESHILTTEMVVAFALMFAVLNFNQTIKVIKPLLLAVVLTFAINAFL